VILQIDGSFIQTKECILIYIFWH